MVGRSWSYCGVPGVLCALIAGIVVIEGHFTDAALCLAAGAVLLAMGQRAYRRSGRI